LLRGSKEHCCVTTRHEHLLLIFRRK
jgi:hypothetical protein